MKNFKKLSVLLGILPVMLTSCQEFEKKAFYVETSDSPEYSFGQYYQAGRKNSVESIYLIAQPLNPDKADNESYKYPLTWKYPTNTEFFTLTDGLKEKRIDGVLKITDNVVMVNIVGSVSNSETNFGYIKVHFRAFTSHSTDTREAYLYAYVGLGDEPLMVDKEEYKSFCLETGITSSYVKGKCAQISRILKEKSDEDDEEIDDSFETEKIYIFNNFSSEGYDIKWKDDIGHLDIMFLDGLRGKKVYQVTKIDDHTLEVEIEKSVNNLSATFGYVRIRNDAFTSDNEELKNKNLYAYVSIGDNLDLVDKPSTNLN